MDVLVQHGNEETEGIVGGALRLALAEKLRIDPASLEGLDSEAAAAALRHFVERTPGQEQLPEWLGDDSLDEQRNELIADGIRAALAYELGVHPDRVARINVVGAAQALDRIRSRRLLRDQAETALARDAALEDDRVLVGQILQEALGEQLNLPGSALDGLENDLAAHILARMIELRRQAEARLQPAPEEAAHDRRNLVARVVRDAIAQDIDVHPRVLGSLDPTAAALLLGRFAQARRTMDVLRSNVATDELTEALRRSAGEVELEREIRRVRRTGNGRLVVAFIDMDALKLVNDSRGHSAGDDLLRQLVATLQHRLRAYDSIVRWGGDEFLVILPQTDLDDAGSIMNEVRQLFAERTQETFSYGLAALEDEESVADLVRRADHRLYDAKRARHAPPVEVPPALSSTPAMEPAAEPAVATEARPAPPPEASAPAEEAPPAPAPVPPPAHEQHVGWRKWFRWLFG